MALNQWLENMPPAEGDGLDEALRTLRTQRANFEAALKADRRAGRMRIGSLFVLLGNLALQAPNFACGGSPGGDNHPDATDSDAGRPPDMQPMAPDAETPDGNPLRMPDCNNSKGKYFAIALIHPDDPDTHVAVPANDSFPELAGDDLLFRSGSALVPVCAQLNVGIGQGDAPSGEWEEGFGLNVDFVDMTQPLDKNSNPVQAVLLPGADPTVTLPGQRPTPMTQNSEGDFAPLEHEFTDDATVVHLDGPGPVLSLNHSPEVPEMAEGGVPGLQASVDAIGNITVFMHALDEASPKLAMLRLSATDENGNTVPLIDQTDTVARFVIPAGVLSPGSHRITATVTDNYGRRGERTVTVNVPDLTPPPAPVVSPLAGIVSPPGTVTVGPSYVPTGVPVRVSVSPGTDPATIIGMRIREAPDAAPRSLAYTPGASFTDTAVPDPSSCEFQLIKTGGIEGPWGSVLTVVLDSVPPGAAVFFPPGPVTVGPGTASVSETVTMPMAADLASATLLRSDGVTAPLDPTPRAVNPLSLTPGFTYTVETVDATGENRSESAPLEIDVDSVPPGSAVFDPPGLTVGLAEAGIPQPFTVTLPSDADFDHAELFTLSAGTTTPLAGAAGETIPLSLLPGNTYYVVTIDIHGNRTVSASLNIEVDSVAPAAPAVVESPDAVWMNIGDSPSFSFTDIASDARSIRAYLGTELMETIPVPAGTSSMPWTYDAVPGEIVSGTWTFAAVDEYGNETPVAARTGAERMYRGPTLTGLAIDCSGGPLPGECGASGRGEPPPFPTTYPVNFHASNMLTCSATVVVIDPPDYATLEPGSSPGLVSDCVLTPDGSGGQIGLLNYRTGSDGYVTYRLTVTGIGRPLPDGTPQTIVQYVDIIPTF